MDTSEKYIKMCEKAEEIQEDWQPKVGDWFLHDWHGTTGFGKLEDTFWKDKRVWEQIECLTYKPSIDDYIEVSREDGSHGVYTSSSLLKDRHIWLPRQDQLWGMLEGLPYIGDSELTWRVNEFNLFIKDEYSRLAILHLGVVSIDQLLEAFVMKEKYNKAWDGEDWGKKA